MHNYGSHKVTMQNYDKKLKCIKLIRATCTCLQQYSTAVHVTLPSAHHRNRNLSSSCTCTVDKGIYNHRGMTNQLDAPETMVHVGVLCPPFRGPLYAPLNIYFVSHSISYMYKYFTPPPKSPWVTPLPAI